MPDKLFLWTIYQNTSDFPGEYVARKFELNQPTNDHFSDPELEKVRRWVKQQAGKVGQGSPYCLPRQPEDDAVVLETWL